MNGNFVMVTVAGINTNNVIIWDILDKYYLWFSHRFHIIVRAKHFSYPNLPFSRRTSKIQSKLNYCKYYLKILPPNSLA